MTDSARLTAGIASIPTMESVSMTARFTRKDWDAVRLAQTRRLLSEKWTPRRRTRLVLTLLVAWGVGYLATRSGAGVPFYAILLGGLTVVVASRLNLQRILKLHLKKRKRNKNTFKV